LLSSVLPSSLLASVLLLPSGALAQSVQPVPKPSGAPQPSPRDELAPGVSDRSLERFRYDCRTEIDRRDVTLFGNGTLRLRQGEPGKESMWLLELAPEDRDGYLARLRGDNREEAERDSRTVSGEWVARCRLSIHLPGKYPEEYEVGRFDSLSLGLQRAVALGEELIDRVDTSAPPEGTTRLPVGYRPEVGDELRRPDGSWFRVDGYTADGSGVELSGIEEPLVLYIATANLGLEFVELRRRERFGR
jgi:hypothetical protein